MRLASATATSFLGLCASIRASHGSGATPRCSVLRITDMAPTTRSRLGSRCPIFEILPSRGLPPVLCWRGARPSQAEKSRPRRKPESGGASACKARAVTGPTPGTLIAWRASSSSRAAARNARSCSAIFRSNSAICSRSSAPSARTRSGRPDPASESADARRRTCADPAARQAQTPQDGREAHSAAACAGAPAGPEHRAASSRPAAPPSSPLQSASSGATPPRRSPPHPPWRSSGASHRA